MSLVRNAAWVILIAASPSLTGCGGRGMPLVRPLDRDADVPADELDADIYDASNVADTDLDEGPAPDIGLDAERFVDAEHDEDGELDGRDADDIGDADTVVDADTSPDADIPPTELSCVTGAYCAMCCPLDDLICQLGCVAEAPPSVVVEVTAVVACVASSGCGSSGGALDFPCITEACGEQLAACSGGTGGTVGCLGTAWCLVSSNCATLPTCPEQGLCYQGCLDDARPEVVGVALELLACIGSSCAADCAAGISTPECLTCLGVNCGPSLAGCIGL